MNAVEHIVECYFRYCKNCFTMSDVKIVGGNNRQCDLLAFNLATQEQFHVESSVTHDLNWLLSDSGLSEVFDKKFRGVAPKRDGGKTDYAKGKTYLDNIHKTYSNVGFDPAKVQRVFVTWSLREETVIETLLTEYAVKYGINIQVYLFRDQILPELMSKISTSNYEDEVLRTLSLLRQRDLQMK